MSKIFEDAQKRINDLLAERDNKKEDFTRNLVAERAAITAAEKAMEAAFAAEDMPGYQAAKADRIRAEVGAEMCERKLTELAAAPLITGEEYDQTKNEILAAIKEADDKAREQLHRLASQMQQIGDNLEKTINRGNQLLNTWQHVIYRDPAEVRGAKGAVHVDLLEVQYKERGTVYWARVAANHHQAHKEG